MANKRDRSARTFLYLMRNERNGFTKIGIAQNPVYREQTLQSQEPEVTLVAVAKTFVYVEWYVHECFHDKRIRGEWFALDDEDLVAVSRFINDAEFWGSNIRAEALEMRREGLREIGYGG